VCVEFCPPRAGEEIRTRQVDRRVYILEDDEARTHLLRLLTQLVQQNTQAKVICTKCSSIFEGLGMGHACPACGSTFLIHYEEQPEKENIMMNEKDNNNNNNSNESKFQRNPIAIAQKIPKTAASAASAILTPITSAASAAADLIDGVRAETGGLLGQISGATSGVIGDVINAGGGDGGGDGSAGWGDMEKQEFSAETMDVNLQLHLRLNFFKGGAAEQLVYFFPAFFAPYGSKNFDETLGYILLTTQNLYILAKKRKPTLQDPGFVMMAEHKLSELRRLTIGLYYHYFRIEVNERTAYVFITREHDRTHRFLDLLLTTVHGCEEAFDPIEPCNGNRETLQHISKQLLAQFSHTKPNVQLYGMLFQRNQPTSSKTGFFDTLALTSKSGDGLVGRSLIVTKKEVVLANEDCIYWPRLHGAKQPPVPQFELVAIQQLSDLIAIELDGGDKTGIKLIFEKENAEEGGRAVFNLKTQSERERARIAKVLSHLWEEMFKLPLNVLTTKA
jgi:DNA-directed RNA polymerase subunit RPC12/RpoP